MKRAGSIKQRSHGKASRVNKNSDRTDKLARVNVDKVVAIVPPVPLETLQLIANDYNTTGAGNFVKPAPRKPFILALRHLLKYLDVATIADVLDWQDMARSGTAWPRAELFVAEAKFIANSLETDSREPREAEPGLPPKQWLIGVRLPALWTEVTGECFTLGSKDEDGDRYLRSPTHQFCHRLCSRSGL